MRTGSYTSSSALPFGSMPSDRLRLRLGELPHDVLAELAAQLCFQSTALQAAADECLAAHKPLPLWAIERVLLSPDLVTHSLSSHIFDLIFHLIFDPTVATEEAQQPARGVQQAPPSCQRIEGALAAEAPQVDRTVHVEIATTARGRRRGTEATRTAAAATVRRAVAHQQRRAALRQARSQANRLQAASAARRREPEILLARGEREACAQAGELSMPSPPTRQVSASAPLPLALPRPLSVQSPEHPSGRSSLALGGPWPHGLLTSWRREVPTPLPYRSHSFEV